MDNQSAKFSSLLDQYDQFINIEEKKKEEEENEHLQFVKDFINIRNQIISPVFERLKVETEKRSHKVYIETEKPLDEGVNIFETYITFYIDLSSPEYHLKHHIEKDDLPHLGFICDIQREKIRTHESTIGPGHGGHIGWQKEFRLNDITQERVDEEVISWLESLVRDITNK